MNNFADILAAFYRENRQALYTYALLLTGNRTAAEDAVHTGFANILHRGIWPREIRPYVFRCIRNAAIDEQRRHIRQAKEDSIFEEKADEDTWNRMANQEQAELLLQSLREKERECVVLKIYGRMTFEEISETLGSPMGTVTSWYRRALERMREILEETTHG